MILIVYDVCARLYYSVNNNSQRRPTRNVETIKLPKKITTVIFDVNKGKYLQKTQVFVVSFLYIHNNLHVEYIGFPLSKLNNESTKLKSMQSPNAAS